MAKRMYVIIRSVTTNRSWSRLFELGLRVDSKRKFDILFLSVDALDGY